MASDWPWVRSCCLLVSAGRTAEHWAGRQQKPRTSLRPEALLRGVRAGPVMGAEGGGEVSGGGGREGCLPEGACGRYWGGMTPKHVCGL